MSLVLLKAGIPFQPYMAMAMRPLRPRQHRNPYRGWIIQSTMLMMTTKPPTMAVTMTMVVDRSLRSIGEMMIMVAPSIACGYKHFQNKSDANQLTDLSTCSGTSRYCISYVARDMYLNWDVCIPIQIHRQCGHIICDIGNTTSQFAGCQCSLNSTCISMWNYILFRYIRIKFHRIL